MSNQKISQRQLDAEKLIEDRRSVTIEKIISDPYFGFKTLDDALAAYKCSTQAEVLARLLARENVFISGLAGSGKTTVIKRFFDLIDAEHSGAFQMALTASTGIAATLIGGRTIHSWSGLGLGEQPFTEKSSDLPPSFWARKKEIAEVDILVIDEISMLPAYFFINLDKMLKYVKRNKDPFGGVQLILTGDFLQLPPISKQGSDLDCRFAIETDEWKVAEIKCCFMDRSYRATDERLKNLLREISVGRVSQESKNLLKTRMTESVKDPNKVYTTLYTTNANVDKYNKEKLDAEQAPLHTFTAYEYGDRKKVEESYKKMGIPKDLQFKVGATVILTKNIPGEKRVANGSLGKILSIDEADYSISVKFNEGSILIIRPHTYNIEEKKEKIENGKKLTYPEIVAIIEQFPLKLGYAITVHKSQGQTFDGVVVDLSKCFQAGLGYVALSRVRSIDDLVIQGFTDKAYNVSHTAKGITRVVKTWALANRHDFIEERDYYETFLIDHLCRRGTWDREDRLTDHQRKRQRDSQ